MLKDLLNNYRIILASRSPRRRQLLHDMGLNFEVVARDYEESYPATLKGVDIALHLARQKSESFTKEILPDEIIITADTIVWCDDEVLGKPADASEARRMIKALSGNTHEVITGVALLSSSKKKIFADTTRVTFENLTAEEIDYYIDNFKPYDKAGAYGIQEWIGIAACSRIEGSYFNVVGLPVQKLYKELKEFVR
jgi:septum formation protein